MPVINHKQYVDLTSKKRELQKLLSECGDATIERIGRAVEVEAEKLVPQPPARGPRNRRRSGALKGSIRLIIRRPVSSGRAVASITTGAGLGGFHYGALVEGIVKPAGRSYTATPFERPAFDRVLPRSRQFLAEEARKRQGRL